MYFRMSFFTGTLAATFGAKVCFTLPSGLTIALATRGS